MASDDNSLIGRVGRYARVGTSVGGLAVKLAGERYLVSTRGNAGWVRNLRAAGGRGELTVKGKTMSFLAAEVPLEERKPLIEAYRKVAGKTVARYWKALPGDADHPVFRLDPS